MPAPSRPRASRKPHRQWRPAGAPRRSAGAWRAWALALAGAPGGSAARRWPDSRNSMFTRSRIWPERCCTSMARGPSTLSTRIAPSFRQALWGEPASPILGPPRPHDLSGMVKLRQLLANDRRPLAQERGDGEAAGAGASGRAVAPHRRRWPRRARRPWPKLSAHCPAWPVSLAVEAMRSPCFAIPRSYTMAGDARRILSGGEQRICTIKITPAALLAWYDRERRDLALACGARRGA